MTRSTCIALGLMWLVSATAYAVDYRVEVLKESPPSEDLSAELIAKLDTSGFRIIRGEKTPYCDIWLCKELEVAADVKLPSMVFFPFRQGQLMGVARYARNARDFRDQDIAAGLYTLRFALQPTDGAHEGVFPTRDFLLLVSAEKDTSAADMKQEKQLNELSAAAVESSHPGLLAVKRPEGAASDLPSIRHDEENNWWLIRLAVKGKAAAAVRDLDLELVVVGHAAE